MADYKVLSRKYRPIKLLDVVGQDFTVKAISNAFTFKKLSHAFLFTGIRGVGKTTIARIIAMGLNCEKFNGLSANPCGECSNCQAILQDRLEDVLEIDAASNTGVDDVREIISSLKYRPSKGKYKIISFYAKKARGLMAAWILKNKIKEDKLNNFNSDGYYFSPEESSKNSPVFLRD